MENDDKLPWWRSTLNALSLLVGLVVLSVVLMAFIVLVARHFDKSASPQVIGAIRLDLTTPPPPGQNAKTREQTPYGPFTTPNSPGRPAAFEGSGGRGPRGIPPHQPAEQEPLVGVPIDEYRAAVDSGRKVYLPNPKGECDLSGASVAKSTEALENCFAQRAAR